MMPDRYVIRFRNVVSDEHALTGDGMYGCSPRPWLASESTTGASTGLQRFSVAGRKPQELRDLTGDQKMLAWRMSS
jgi:hypothetical protein